jgi:hypothetical protein
MICGNPSTSCRMGAAAAPSSACAVIADPTKVAGLAWVGWRLLVKPSGLGFDMPFHAV